MIDFPYFLIRLREELGLSSEATQVDILADIKSRMAELYEARQEIEYLNGSVNAIVLKSEQDLAELRKQLGRALMRPHEYATKVVYQINCEPDQVIDMLNSHISKLNQVNVELTQKLALMEMRDKYLKEEPKDGEN